MIPERRLRILGQLVQADHTLPSAERLCQVSAEVTDTDGAGIMLVHDGVSRGSVSSTGRVSAIIEELQFTLGEGPGIDACRDGRPVLEPDLAAPATSRWIAFAPPAVEAGVAAVFGFPVRIGAVVLGALHLHRLEPGPLTDEQHADALVLADIAAEFILLVQAGASPGNLAAELETGAGLHYVVHQASGMVSVQLGVSVEDAMVRLRAHAFTTGTPLVDLARAVVARSVRFERHDADGSDR